MSVVRVPVGLLPHRGTALLIESAELVEKSELLGRQIVPKTHPILEGHFPEFHLWPGALLIEAMAQTAALLHLKLRGESLGTDELPVLGAVEARFLAPVLPGDQLLFRANLVRKLENNALFSVSVERVEQIVARGRISAGIVHRSELAVSDHRNAV